MNLTLSFLCSLIGIIQNMSCSDTFTSYKQRTFLYATVWFHWDLVQWNWMQQQRWCQWHGPLLLTFILLPPLNKLRVTRYVNMLVYQLRSNELQSVFIAWRYVFLYSVSEQRNWHLWFLSFKLSFPGNVQNFGWLIMYHHWVWLFLLATQCWSCWRVCWTNGYSCIS